MLPDAFLRKLMFFAAAILCSTVLVCSEARPSDAVSKQHVKIGVVQLEDPFFYLDCFGPTMEYLRKKHPEIRFSTEEINLNISPEDLNKKPFDFLISPSGFFCGSYASNGTKTNRYSETGVF